MEELRVTEMTPTPRVRHTRQCFHHSVYEWLTLVSSLFVPLVVGILTVVLPLQQQNLSNRQNENSKMIAINNRIQDVELLHEQQKQIILNTFEHDLSELLLRYKSVGEDQSESDDGDDDGDLSTGHHNERLSSIVRTKALHAMRQLDPARKLLAVQLLIDSGVQKLINISHADLSSLVFPPGSRYDHLQLVNVIARNLTLERMHLYQSNFSYSILDGSSFYASNCSSADFSFASLQRTNWSETDVSGAMFNSTNLSGATITEQQLATVGSLLGAMLPNGTTVAMGPLNRVNFS